MTGHNSPFAKVFFTSASVFALKSMIIKSIAIRARVGGQAFAWPEDSNGLSIFLPLFKTLLFAFPTKKEEAEELIDRANAVEINNIQNESYFLLALASWSYFTTPPAYAIPLVYGFVAARVVHNVAFLGKSEPFRTLAFIPGLAATIFVSTQALIASLKK